MPDRLLGNQPRISSAQAQWLANAQRMCFPPVPWRPAVATNNTSSATQRLALFGGQELLGVSGCRHPPQSAVPPTARKAANPVNKLVIGFQAAASIMVLETLLSPRCSCWLLNV